MPYNKEIKIIYFNNYLNFHRCRHTRSFIFNFAILSNRLQLCCTITTVSFLSGIQLFEEHFVNKKIVISFPKQSFLNQSTTNNINYYVPQQQMSSTSSRDNWKYWWWEPLEGGGYKIPKEKTKYKPQINCKGQQLKQQIQCFASK